MLQAGHVDEVVPVDEHVARAEGLPEVDDGTITVVAITVGLAVLRVLWVRFCR